MRIIGLEMAKALRSPLVAGLLVVFTALNLFVMYGQTYQREELQVLSSLVSRFGHDMNGEGYERLSDYYKSELAAFNTIAEAKLGRTYDSAAEFAGSNPQLIDPARPFTDDEVELTQRLLVTERYVQAVPELREQYADMDMWEIAKGMLDIMTKPTSDEVDRIVYANYDKLEQRVIALREQGEHLHLFFQGVVHKLHSFLYKHILGLMLYQMMLLSVLITAQIMNYETDRNTHPLMYATRRGRRLQRDKLAAALLSSLLAAVVLLAVNLTAYFRLFDYSELWQVPISTGLMREFRFTPYIAWWPFRFAEYLGAVIGLALVLQLIFAGLAAWLAHYVRNSYFVCCMFLLLLGAGWVVITVTPPGSLLIFAAYANPFQLLWVPHGWFMMKNVFSTYPSYELVTVGSWLVIVAALLGLARRHFIRRDLR